MVAKLDPRQELVYRLALRGLSDRCRGDRAFTERTDALMAEHSADLAAVLAEAAQLARKLTEG